jgi:peroxiredoxin
VRPKRVGDFAPAFTLPAVDGRTISLEELYARGAVVGLICECGGHEGLVTAASYAAAAGDQAVVGVMRGSRERVTAFAAEHHITTPLLIDEDGIVEREFGYNVHPTYVFVDRSGRIVSLTSGDFGYAKNARGAFEREMRKTFAAIALTPRGR